MDSTQAHSPDAAPVFLLSGTPGVGKTSVAAALMRRFPYGIHIPMDDLREWVVSGIAHPVPEWTAETTRQFRLARNAAAAMVKSYSDAGFAVAVDDVMLPEDADQHYLPLLTGRRVMGVLLRPRIEIALARNRDRTNKPFDTGFLNMTIQRLYETMRPEDFTGAGWMVLDSSEQTLEETVTTILTAGGFSLPT
jgi:chloramphenicol 3-O-phosphotransferase